MDAAIPASPVEVADSGIPAPAALADADHTPIAGETTPPTTPELAATAVAAVAAGMSAITVEPIAVEPIAVEPIAVGPIAVEPIASEPISVQPLAVDSPAPAVPAEPLIVPPLSRRARRAPRPVNEPDQFAPSAGEMPEPVETVAPPLPDAVLTPADPFELLEPVVVTEPVTVDQPVTEPTEEQRHAASDVDEFEAAARLFSFTGETPIQADAESEAIPTAPHTGHRHSRPTAGKPRVAPRAVRPSNGAAFKRITAASFSVGVMSIVGLLTVGMTTPAEAVAVASGSDNSTVVVAPGDAGPNIDPDAIQAYVAPATAEDVQLNRTENYATVTTAQLAQQSGIHNFSNFFVNNPNSPIQWPFAVGVPISYGFGMRSGRMHEGVDFTPGAGSPIQAIADGVVRIATNSGGAYGVTVVIDHHIDGQLVSSRYAHMQYGSLQVAAGQHVTVGTVIGRTGNTGRSYGAHTHFEILLGGTTAIDPIPWLRAHAGG
ncbi:hypothetical protein GCM10009776_25610 [Microbacterium deminutum]|uniref:M23ase beta-sheet core domain-containing protein n=2 Tax=Microbacterium deminutum TaxID=344164 RepID=A0ABN2R1C2_9MICO